MCIYDSFYNGYFAIKISYSLSIKFFLRLLLCQKGPSFEISGYYSAWPQSGTLFVRIFFVFPNKIYWKIEETAVK